MSFTFKDYMHWSSEIHDKIEDELRLICIPGSKVMDVILHIENRIDELTDEYTHYFVITPFLSHFQELKKISSFKNKKIWCECCDFIKSIIFKVYFSFLNKLKLISLLN